MIRSRKAGVHSTFKTNVQFLVTRIQLMLQQYKVSTNQDSSCRLTFPQVKPNVNIDSKF